MSALARQPELAQEGPVDRFARLISGRPALAGEFAAIRGHAARHMSEDDLGAFAEASHALYQANAGPRVLVAYWRFARLALPGAPAEDLVAAGRAALEICRNAGSTSAARSLGAGETRLRPGAGSGEAATLLAALAGLSAAAPHAVDPVVGSADRLFATLDAAGVAGWIEDGLRLYPKDKARQRRYFTLADPAALRRLALQNGPSLFATHENRLRLLAEALWARPVALRTLVTDAEHHPRSRIVGGLIFVPEAFPGTGPAEAHRLFEACVVHAAAHLQFTGARFAVGKLKPMQIALTALIEDARVERLALAEFPGLARLWLPFHDARASRVQTAQSLFARLARGLVDRDFEDADGWIAKGRALFEAAFAARPRDAMIAREIGNVLGHDLGQLRIPFDAKAYRVEPAYRDDGLGLFDFDDIDPQNTEAIELMVDAVRIEPEDRDGGDTTPAGDEDAARPTASDATDELGPVLAMHPEWDYRLNLDQPDFATVRAYPPRSAAADRLARQVAEHVRVRERIGALVRSARLGRPQRLKRRLEGEEIDIEAAQDVFVALAAGETPDPRIHAVRRRQGRDVSLHLLLDISASTAERVDDTGQSILEVATLAVALLGEALEDLGDPLGIDAFASNGRGDVRLTRIKGFGEPYGEAVGRRLAGLAPGYSTRLGTAIRHAAAELARRASHRRVLIVVTDGEPADIDTDDADYLGQDARRAVLHARAQGLDVFCVALGKAADKAGAAIFGRRNTLAVTRIGDLPGQLAGLYFQLTVR